MSGSRDRVLGYAAGIAAGVAYGLNPVFAKPLLANGVSVPSMLFFRYVIAMAILAIWMFLKGERFKVEIRQVPILVLLGLLFAMSSLFLFAAYPYIPSGLATTLVYLYPVFTAIILIFLKEYPTWQTSLAVLATMAGVALICLPGGGVHLNWTGMLLSILSALSYAVYLVIVNKSGRISSVTPHIITLYALGTGGIMFFILHLCNGGSLLEGIEGTACWLNLLGLAIFPTMVSLLCLAISTRAIGPTKTGVLGVFEPVTAITFSMLLFGETMTANIGIGIVICIAAVLFMIISGSRRKQ